METQPGINQLIADLTQAAISTKLSNESQLIAKAIMNAMQNKSDFSADLQKIQVSGKQELISQIKPMVGQGIDPDPIAGLIWEALNFMANAILYADGDKLGFVITVVFNYILVLISDFKRSSEYYNTPISYNVTNPAQDFWFLRSDTNGIHQFNMNENYLQNTIPNASSNIYSNAEIYNSPYTETQPKCVIASPFPAEKISNENELYNFVYDLFLNVPFAASHNVVFESKIKVENLNGGSRGWGFWNTDALPVLGMKTAWFIQQQGLDAKKNKQNQFQIWTMAGLNTLDVFNIPTPLDENWHTYKIVMNSSSIEYFMDGTSIHKALSSKGSIINGPMAFHNWVDNAFFDLKNGGQKVLQNSSTPRTNLTQNMSITAING